ncbi:MAG TPA: DUF2892 domain-containing protein [Candidatus Desulfovibrio intestinipullorum]|uniref:DUF2892 domain-containing protein n=1 Tax=Candidatus Desulfovibrio intestinipullorum TaxID=2838536 RepID=A0A9D1PVA1_9BACT|nr:DUF2892 domain-containing protein [Candidatus Desulfovibrio intestinipullorum]
MLPEQPARGPAHTLEGGREAWEKAGLPVACGRKESLERQVRMVAGSIILCGRVLSLAHGAFPVLPLVRAAALSSAGATGACAMADSFRQRTACPDCPAPTGQERPQRPVGSPPVSRAVVRLSGTRKCLEALRSARHEFPKHCFGFLTGLSSARWPRSHSLLPVQENAGEAQLAAHA